ncbi:hypothetical protein MRX96_050834 [Rhipicephalus microplus]
MALLFSLGRRRTTTTEPLSLPAVRWEASVGTLPDDQRQRQRRGSSSPDCPLYTYDSRVLRSPRNAEDEEERVTLVREGDGPCVAAIPFSRHRARSTHTHTRAS